MAPAPYPALPERIGRYRIVRRIGMGGMAEVLLAKSSGAEGVEKVLIVKRILPNLAKNQEFISMFVGEARVEMRLNHPNVVQVYAFEQVKDEFLLAMEFVDGLDLGALMKATQKLDEQIPFGVSAFIASEVAKGLEYVHNRKDEHGVPMEIVHRDVSPQNILLSYEGVVKVADFGIARARMVSGDTGVVKGKFAYMSPEQARGQRVDRRSDIYTLGVVLAEMLMGRSMYPGIAGFDVLEKVRAGEVVQPKDVVKDIPDDLGTIVAKATQFERDDRYPTARAFAEDLLKWLHKQEEMFDAATVEQYIREIVPNRNANVTPLRVKRVSAPALQAVARSSMEPEIKERRHVVVVSGRVRFLRSSSSDTHISVGVFPEAVRVLDEIAYKGDAVLFWPERAEVDRDRFCFTLGLGRTSLYDPLRAMRLALDVIEALDGFAESRVPAISACVGISRGTVSASRDVQGRLLRYEPEGSVMQVAEALADAGEPGEVLSAGEVYRLTRRNFVFDDAAKRSVRVRIAGHSRGIRAYALSGMANRAMPKTALATLSGNSKLVGRQDELKAIAEAYREVTDNRQSAFVAIVGELGVGKTTLAQAAVAELGDAPLILRTECAFGAWEFPFEVLKGLLQDLATIRSEDNEEEKRRKLQVLVGAACDDAAQVTAIVEGLEPLIVNVAAQGRDEGIDRSVSIVRAARDLVVLLAEQRPVVIVIDDLQWADSPTLRALANIVRRGIAVPLMGIFVTRPDERINAVVSGAAQLEVGDLPEGERKELLSSCLGAAEISPEVQNAVLDRTGGNPFFIKELVEMMVERHAVRAVDKDGQQVVELASESIPLPTTLEEAIAARLQNTSVKQKKALSWLAVSGSALNLQRVATLAGGSFFESLQSLERNGLLSRNEQGYVRFSSPVVRQIAYENTEREQRRQMHHAIALELTKESIAASPAYIAHHLEAGGDIAGASQYYLAAANAARWGYSNRAALRLYGRALTLLPKNSRDRFFALEAREQILRGLGKRKLQRTELQGMRQFSEMSADPELIAVAYNRLARYELGAGQSEGVSELIQQALEHARRSGSLGPEIEALRLTTELHRVQAQFDQSLAACDRALGRLGYSSQWLPARGSALVERALTLQAMGKHQASLEPVAEALVIFRRFGIKRNEARALDVLGMAIYALGDHEDAIAVTKHSLRLDREIGDRFFAGIKLTRLGEYLASAGDTELSLRFLRRALDAYDVVPDLAGRGRAACSIAELFLVEHADTAAASQMLDEVQHLSMGLKDQELLARECWTRALLLFQQGAHARAATLAEEAQKRCERAHMLHESLFSEALFSETLAWMGQLSKASDRANAVQRRLSAMEGVSRHARILLSLGRTFELVGDKKKANLLYQQAQLVVKSQVHQVRDLRLRTLLENSATVRAVGQAHVR